MQLIAILMKKGPIKSGGMAASQTLNALLLMPLMIDFITVILQCGSSEYISCLLGLKASEVLSPDRAVFLGSLITFLLTN